MIRHFLTISLVAVLGTVSASAQQPASDPGIITGRVIDEKTAQPLTEVTVQIVGQEVVGTKLAAYTGIDGRYRLVNVRPGTVTIQVRRIGYTPKTVTGIYLEPGKTIEQDIALTPGSTQLAAVVVSADAERGTTAEAIDNMRVALGQVSMITRQDIAKSPDSDASQVTKRLGAVAMDNDGKANIRGLDPRYSSTSVNGSRAPSPDPEQKSVPLDLFPAALLDGITVSKTFTPDQPGDFSGAQLEIKTREFPAVKTATYSIGSGMNAGATGETLPLALGVGGESFALAGSERSLPGMVAAAGDLSGTTPAQRNAMINSFRNIWRPVQGGAQPNASMSATVGGSDQLRGHNFGYIASGTYSLNHEVHLTDQRALARPTSVGQGTEAYNAFAGTGASTTALWGGILNLSTLLGSHSRVQLNNTYTRTADNAARTERGYYEDLSIPVSIERMDYVQRSVWSSQLVAERESEANRIKFVMTGSGVSREQPDRSELVRQVVTDPSGAEKLLWVSTIPEAAARTFADLNEHSIESAVSFTHRFQKQGNHSVKFGALGRHVNRDADTRAYGIYSLTMTDDVRALPPEVLFGGQFTQPDSTLLSLRSLAQGGSYTAKDYIAAGYGMYDGALSERWRITTGARYEFSLARVNAVSTLGEKAKARRLFNDVLPSVAFTFVPNNTQQVRLSLTRTLARPEYRELAPIRTRDVLGGTDVRGNQDLVRTLIDNADVRWEFYPERGQVFAVGVFAKRFQNAIERVYLASNTNSLVSYQNAAGGSDLGVEVEARRNLGFLNESLDKLSAFGNVAVMHSEVDLGTTSASATNPKRAMTGQAPYILNAGMTYGATGGDFSATLLFNRIGDRIVNAGELPLPDVIEKASSTLDLSLRFPVLRGVAGRFDAKNLLDDPFEERQGTVIRESYRTGRVFQLGFTWR